MIWRKPFPGLLICLFCASCWSPFPLQGQASRSGAPAVFLVQLEETEEAVTTRSYASVNDLGFFKTVAVERSPGEELRRVKVCVGPFLGKEAADLVLAIARSRGYAEAFIQAETYPFEGTEGKELTYTVQVGAFNKLDISKYQGIANLPAYGLFITYEEGMFKVLAGMYPESDKEYLREQVLPYYRRELGLDGFVRAFRN